MTTVAEASSQMMKSVVCFMLLSWPCLAAAESEGPGLLELACPCPKAAVFVDDKPVGTIPLSPIKLSAGQHTVRIEAKKLPAIQRQVLVAPDQTARLTVSWPPPRPRSAAMVVVDLNTGEELLAKNPDEKRSIASVSKLMATLVVLESGLDLTADLKIVRLDRRNARGGKRSRLRCGATYRIRDLVSAALMSSDNWATVALGRGAGLAFADHVQRMNDKATALGLEATRFADPTGISHGNVSTAREVIRMLRVAMGNPIIASTTQVSMIRISPVGKKRRSKLYYNTNGLVRRSDLKVLAGKTGYNSKAGYCLAVAAEAAGRVLGAAMLGAPKRRYTFTDFLRVVKWLKK